MSSSEEDGGTSSSSEETQASELREIQKLEGHAGPVWSVAWNPVAGVSSKTLAIIASCGEDKTVRIWEQLSLSSLSFHYKAILEGKHSKAVLSCAWSKSGKKLATPSSDTTIAIWEIIEGDYKCTSTLDDESAIEKKSVSWNTLFIATCGGDKSVCIWEGKDYLSCDELVSEEADMAEEVDDHTQDVKMVVWHPEAYVLFSCSSDNNIKTWDRPEGDWDCVQTLDGRKNSDRTLKIWEVDLYYTDKGAIPPHCAYWKHLSTLSGYHDKIIYSVHWSRDDIIATGGEDNCIRWFAEPEDESEDEPEDEPEDKSEDEPEEKSEDESESEDEQNQESTFELLGQVHGAHEMKVNCVQWSPTQPELLASASDDGTVKIWELLRPPSSSGSRSGSGSGSGRGSKSESVSSSETVANPE